MDNQLSNVRLRNFCKKIKCPSFEAGLFLNRRCRNDCNAFNIVKGDYKNLKKFCQETDCPGPGGQEEFNWICKEDCKAYQLMKGE